jgi:hypothetical protein
MRNHVFGLIAALGLGVAGPGLAQAQGPTVVRDGDATLTCRQMADEAATLSAGMGGGNGGGGLLGRLGEVARAGAAMVVPGAGLALAGADALTSSDRERREARADAGRDRWNYLNGLYAGKGCGGPESRPDPEAETLPAPQASSEASRAVASPRIQPTALVTPAG